MGYLSDASSSVSDFSKFVITCLARWPSTAAFPPGIVEFGQTTNGPCGITFLGDGSIEALLVGGHNTYIPVFGGVPQSGRTAQIGIISPSAIATTDVYYRVIVSGDFSTGAEFTYNGTPGSFTFVSNGFRWWLSVGDVDYSPTSFNGPGSLVVSGQPAGSFLPGVGGLSNTADVSLPNLTIPISGLEFSIPCLAANADPTYNSKFEIAEFRMWTGVSLDTSVTGNRRLFINADGSSVNPTVASDSLGTPVYDFRGGSADFLTNRGSAGALIKTGTVSDFTPGP